MVQYVVAIPSYHRSDVISQKTLHTLQVGGVKKSRIYIFVANQDEKHAYECSVPKSLYKEIVVGKLGIANQRNFISHYFPKNQYVVSMDDDIEAVTHRTSPTHLSTIRDLDHLFREAHAVLKREHLFLWGIYPVNNPFFMKPTITTDLRFCIGVMHGFISRQDPSLKLSVHSETKEDYEHTILYYQKDGGVVRFNSISIKTKFHADGGLGKDRIEKNRSAAEYLEKTYPEIVSRFSRKNGMPEVKLKARPRLRVLP
jgi:hypothetical protein